MIIKLVLLLATASAVIGVTRVSADQDVVVVKNTRISTRNGSPDNVEPLDYDIFMVLLNDLSYVMGKVEILVAFKEPGPKKENNKLANKLSKYCANKILCATKKPSNMIILNLDGCYNVLEAEIHYAKTIEGLGHHGGTKLGHQKLRDVRNHLLGLKLNTDLPHGGFGRITIFYKDSSDDHTRPACMNKVEKVDDLALLRPERARELLPSFDQLNIKTKMHVTVSTPDDGRSLITNTAQRSEPNPFKRWGSIKLLERKFFQTNPMSVNELFFMLGPFDESLVSNVGQVQAYVITQPDHHNEAGFALDLVRRSMIWFQEYTGLKYPLKSYQLVAVSTIPEHWHTISGLGLGFVVAKDVLLKDKMETLERRAEAAVHVALEVSRQWFERMVSPRTRSDSWITEGLGAYVAFRMLSDTMPELGALSNLKSHLLPILLKLDAQMRLPSLMASDARESSSLTATKRLIKSASIIDIIEKSIAVDLRSFDDALRGLVESKAYSSGISSADLAAAFANDKFNADDIEGILGPWSGFRGFPVVHVTTNDKGMVCLRQKDDLLTGDNLELEPFAYEYVWPLPLKVQFTENKGHKSHVIPVPITQFQTSSMICYERPSWFELSEDSTNWVEVMPEKDDALLYYQVEYHGVLAKLHERSKSLPEPITDATKVAASSEDTPTLEHSSDDEGIAPENEETATTDDSSAAAAPYEEPMLDQDAPKDTEESSPSSDEAKTQS